MDVIIDSVDMSMSKLWEIMKDGEAWSAAVLEEWSAAVHGVSKNQT